MNNFGLTGFVRRLWQSLRGRSGSANAVVTPGHFAVAELPALLTRRDPLILEIGANDGTHTRAFLDLFPQARVHAFEPDARARARFVARDDPRVQLHAAAVGARDGVTAFYPSDGAPNAESAARMPEGWDLSGSIRPPKAHLAAHPWCRFGAAIEVPLVRLDSWARAHGVDAVDFIWADVQGAERELIEGGRETLARTRYFYTEYSDHELYEGQPTLAELLRLLPDFEVVKRFRDRYQGDVLLRNRRPAG